MGEGAKEGAQACGLVVPSRLLSRRRRVALLLGSLARSLADLPASFNHYNNSDGSSSSCGNNARALLPRQRQCTHAKSTVALGRLPDPLPSASCSMVSVVNTCVCVC